MALINGSILMYAVNLLGLLENFPAEDTPSQMIISCMPSRNKCVVIHKVQASRLLYINTLLFSQQLLNSAVCGYHSSSQKHYTA